MSDGIFKPGDRLGDYEILAELGGGGMGRVYRARDLTLERTIALKTLAPQLRQDQMIVQRFLMEARAAARLNHPNIVQIYDFGKEGDTYYLAMEFVEGDSLATLLQRGPFAESDAITITRLTCQALAVAHAEGLVHRDIKPDNLMLTRKGEVKLVDLGVAKRIGEAAEAKSLTQPGQALGTPHYISPEQIGAAADIDGRADIYSLGATLYHLVTGKVPFTGTTSAMVMSAHLYHPLEDPRTHAPHLSEGLFHVLRKMMAKDPADRYADADATDRDLYQLEIGEMPEAANERFEPVESPSAAKTAVSRVPGSVRTGAFEMQPPMTQPPSHAAGPQRTAKSPPATQAAPPSSPTPAKNTAIPNLTGLATDPNLKVLETELARHVGPLARVLVKRAAKNASSMGQLIATLEQEIAGDKPRREFRSAVDKLR